jgi:hypothetical protein
MKPIRAIVTLALVASLAIASLAFGAIKVNGGTTQITLNPAVTNALSSNHLTVTPLTPATSSGSTYTFPIRRGRLNKKNLRGVILQRGGFAISNGTRTVRIRHLTLVSRKQGVYLWATVRVPAKKPGAHGPKAHAARFSVRRVARITGITVTKNTKTATGTVRLTKYSAGGINALAGKNIAAPGTAIGQITVTAVTH